MLYTPAVNKALKLCAEIHTDQKDKNGIPYLAHPLHLAEQMNTEAETCAALLHDVLEDGAISTSELLAHGIPAEAINALILLTHEEGVPYLDYVQAIKDGNYGSREPINGYDAALDRLYRSDLISSSAHDSHSSDDPLEEGARIARKVKLADLKHNSELGRLGLVTSRDLKRLNKYREARVILDDLVYKERTPIGSFALKVNGKPYAFHVEHHFENMINKNAAQYFAENTSPDSSALVFQVDTLPLIQDDKIEAKYYFGDTIIGYESNDVAVSTTSKKGGAIITFSAVSAYKFNYTDQYPFQLLSRMGTYKMVNDPIRYRYYSEAHTIEYVLSWNFS